MNLHRDWAAEFRRFAREECPAQATTSALCRTLAAWPALNDWMALPPPDQARVNLLLAAVHERVLSGAADELTPYFPSVGGLRAPDQDFDPAVHALLRREAAVLCGHLRNRATQTNETGRCAVLRLALDALVAQTGARRLALFDFGASAGLNLGVDADRVEVAGRVRGAGTRLHLRCDWRGGALPSAQDWTLTARMGVDLAPIDPSQAESRRWLEACTWPDDTERLARLRLALAWGDAAVRAGTLQVQRTDDGLRALADWLPGLPAGVQPVLFNSWVLAYLSPEARSAHRARVQALIDTHDLAWLSAEALPCQAWGGDLPAAPEPSATLWLLRSREGARPLMWSHPHGAWARAA